MTTTYTSSFTLTPKTGCFNLSPFVNRSPQRQRATGLACRFRAVCILLLLGLTLTTLRGQAQCPTSDVTLSSQAQVDAFPAGCTNLPGRLTISGPGITNLTALSQLNRVGSDVGIYNSPDLTSLEGLNALTSVGGRLSIYDNPNLSSLTALSQLNSVGSDVGIYNSPGLTSLEGLNALTSVGGRLSIHHNTNLSSLTGLEKLSSVRFDVGIYNNPGLTSLNGLNALTSVGVRLNIYDNPNLSSLTALSQLNSVGSDVGIYNSPGLTNLEGLNALTSVGGILSIYDNPNLSSLTALSQLSSVGSDVNIYNSPGLTSLEGLNALTSVGSRLNIYDNPNLSSLTALSQLNSVRSDVSIYNSPGLTSLEGLNALTSVGGTLRIHGNPNLSSLTGLEKLTNSRNLEIFNNAKLNNIAGLSSLASATNVSIRDNPELISLTGLEQLTNFTGNLGILRNTKLTTCAIASVCQYMASYATKSNISGNAPGCASRAEVQANCNPAMVMALSPVRNANAAPRATEISITLDKPWTGPTSLVSVWSQQAGGKKAGTATVSGNTLTFNPGADFKPGETVSVTAAKASGLVKPEVYQFTAAAAVASGNFGGGSEVEVGNNSSGITTADVDGDGDLDFLAANFSSNTVSVRLNDGNGNFGGTTQVVVGSGPIGITTADVDGDGDLDFLAANFSSNTVSVRLNDGMGNFGGGSEIAVGSGPASIAAADVDGDGDLDFLVVNGSVGSNTVSVRLNDSKGNFGGGSEVAVGDLPASIAAADVDGDGDLDFLVTNFYGGSVSVRLNNGDGTFSGGSEVVVGREPRSIAAADVDGDGDLDFLTANSYLFYNSVSVRLNDGKGNFGGGSEVGVGNNPSGITTADVDGDGDLDFLATNNGRGSNTVSVRLNDSKGNFGGGSEVAVGDLPASIAAADVDVDGDLDFLVVNGSVGSNTVSVRLNGPASAPVAISSQPASTQVCVGSPATFSVTASNATGYQWQVNAGSGFTNLSEAAPYSGTTTATLSISAATAELNGYQYRVVVSGSGSPATSYAATLTVNQAPVSGAITGPTAPVLVNNSVSLSISFTSTIATTAQWNWDDGTTSAGSLNGTGFTGQHIYTTPGVYSPSVILTNDCGQSELVTYQYIVVYDPNGGFVTGAGWFISPARAYIANPDATGRAQFGFVSKYQKGATVPTGKTDFEFKTAALEFTSNFYEWLVIAGAKAQFKGEGTINGAGRYGFLLTALDGQLNGGGGTDKFWIKIWDKNNRDAIVYDNNMGSSDDPQPGTALGGGAIVIHSGGKKSERVTDQPEMAATTAATPLKSYPNPFSRKTTVAFSVKPNEAYSLEVYDVKGSLVKRLQAGKATTGKVVEATWQPEKSVQGVYIIRLVTPSSVQHLRVVQE